MPGRRREESAVIPPAEGVGRRDFHAADVLFTHLAFWPHRAFSGPQGAQLLSSETLNTQS
jgi:hypothetical protein